MCRRPILDRLEARLQRGEPLGVLLDANVLLDVFCQRENAVPAARALTFAELDDVKGFVCASAFGVICHRGTKHGPGRIKRERLLAKETMRLLRVLPLTENVLTAAMGYDNLSFEDAQVAAAGALEGVDTILTNDISFIKGHEAACTPQDLIPLLEQHLGDRCICRVKRVTEQGAFCVEISNPGGWLESDNTIGRIPDPRRGGTRSGVVAGIIDHRKLPAAKRPNTDRTADAAVSGPRSSRPGFRAAIRSVSSSANFLAVSRFM